MLTKYTRDHRDQVEMVLVPIEKLVPDDHILRDIDQAISFDFIYDLVTDTYSELQGRPSIDPVVLVKIILLQHLFGIRSMRQTIKEIQVNMAYRWFLGFTISQEVPHFSTFGKNYGRRFKGTTLFEDIFSRILEEAVTCGFVDAETVFIDATHIKANANKNKYAKEVITIQAKYYQEELEKEIDEDRLERARKILKKKPN